MISVNGRSTALELTTQRMDAAGPSALPLAYFNENEVNVISQAIYEHRNIYKDMSFLGERLHQADNLSRASCSVNFAMIA